MNAPDDLRPDEAALVDDRAAAAFAELRAAVDDLDLDRPSDVVAVASRRSRRWLPAVAAVFVVLAVAAGAALLAAGGGDRVDTGPADGGPTGYYVPTEWPAALDGPTYAGPLIGDELPPTWLLSRDGVPSVVLTVDPPDMSSPATSGAEFAVGGRLAQWVSPDDETHLLVQASADRLVGLRSWTVPGAGLEDLAAVLALDDAGDLDAASLPVGWTLRRDASGLLGLAFSEMTYAEGSSVGRQVLDESGARLGVQQYPVADAAVLLDTFASLLGTRATRVDIGDDEGLRFGQNVQETVAMLVGARLVWSPGPDVLLVSSAVGTSEDEWLAAARSVERIDAAAWADLVDASDRAIADRAHAAGELDGLRWSVPGVDDPMVLPLQLTDPAGRPALAMLQAASGLATVADVPSADRAVVAVAGPAGLSDASLTLRDRELDAAAVDHRGADSTVVFALVPYDDDGLPPPSGVLRLTGRLPDGSAWDSRG